MSLAPKNKIILLSCPFAIVPVLEGFASAVAQQLVIISALGSACLVN